MCAYGLQLREAETSVQQQQQDYATLQVKLSPPPPRRPSGPSLSRAEDEERALVMVFINVLAHYSSLLILDLRIGRQLIYSTPGVGRQLISNIS